MHERCYDPTYHAFERYGGRGIVICPEWKDNFPAFQEWATSSGFRIELELDRRDNDAGYSPDNCRWVDRSTNCKNREKTPKWMAHIRRLGRDPVITALAVSASVKVHSRPVRCVETGEVFPSGVAASAAKGLHRTSVGRVLCGLAKKMGGYHWEYA